MSLVGVAIDKTIQHMQNGQTNGIPQGSVLMDFIAEIILGYADSELTQKLNAKGINDYFIIRYRDDYRVFTNSKEDNETIRGVEYNLKQEFITDPSISSLYTLEILENTEDKMKIVYKINLANDFFSLFNKFKSDADYKPIVTIIKSLVLAELVAPSQGTIGAGNIRLNFNNFLNNS